MRLLVCEECGARHYSASAATLLAQGVRCERCSALLALDEPHDGLAAAVSSESESGRLRRPD